MVGPPPESWSVDVGSAGARAVAPGIWRLRLPLPWPAIPHVNAYALAVDGGIALVDCGGAGDATAGAALEHALAACGHRLEDVRVLLATHTHSDHMGVAQLVLERSGAPFWMHPASAHFYDAMRDPQGVRAARERRARAEGVPEDLLDEFADVREETDGVMAAIDPDLDLVEGRPLPAPLRDWEVLETVGHAPSHVCLLDRRRGIVIVGDVLGPVFSPYFDYGYSADPLGEYMRSLDRLASIDGLALALPGHGRPLADVGSVIDLHRRGVGDALDAAEAAVARGDAGAPGRSRRGCTRSVRAGWRACRT